MIKHDQAGENPVDLLLLARGILIDHLMHGPQCIIVMLPEHMDDPARYQVQVLGSVSLLQTVI
jgi:hypothetical protein